jgi:hypothetical protein
MNQNTKSWISEVTTSQRRETDVEYCSRPLTDSITHRIEMKRPGGLMLQYAGMDVRLGLLSSAATLLVSAYTSVAGDQPLSVVRIISEKWI